MKDIQSPKQKEEIKREYFKMNVNSRLDTSFTFESENDRLKFLDICKYMGSILSLGQIFKQQSSMAKTLCYLKHLCFFLYVVLFPLRGKLSLGFLFLFANACSLLNRKMTLKPSESILHILLADEEAMHIIWLLTYILLGWQLKVFVDFNFLIWSLLNTCELFDYLITKHPGAPIIGSLSGFVQAMQDNTIGIVTLKSYVEVLIVPVSMVAWLFSWCAPVLGIILVQYLRIKFMGSAFTKKAMSGVDACLKSVMPGFLYDITLTPLKNFCSTLSGIKECLENEKNSNDDSDNQINQA